MARADKTVKLSEENHQRLEELKPHERVPFDDVIAELLDDYEAVEA